MNDNIIIREAVPEECFMIGKMWKALMEEAGDYPVEIDDKVVQNFSIQLLTKILRDDGEVFIAEYDYKPIGFITTNLRVYDYCSVIYGYCESVYVDPNFRTFLAGKKLIDTAFKWMKDRGARVAAFDTIYNEKLVKKWNVFGYKAKTIGFSKEIQYG
jgi:GNAT superfamily N-acetyltransferase